MPAQPSPRRNATLDAWSALALCAALFAQVDTASAETQPWSFRSNVGPGVMISDHQRGQPLHFDQPGLIGSLYGALSLRRWLELRVGGHSGFYFSTTDDTGGLLGLTLGARVSAPGRRVTPYATLDFGPGLTGPFTRPLILAGAGVDLQLGERYAMGPLFGYGHVVQWDGPEYTTDGRYVWFALSFAAKLGRTPPAPPPPPRPRYAFELRRPEPPPPPPPPAEPSEDVLTLIEAALPSADRVELLAPVLFAFDSDQLEPLGIAMLHEVAVTLAQRPDLLRLRIEGYADERGDAAYNQALSLRRAARVRAFLIEQGIAPERLTTEPRGENELIEPHDSEPAHAQNRRVVFRVLEMAEP